MANPSYKYKISVPDFDPKDNKDPLKTESPLKTQEPTEKPTNNEKKLTEFINELSEKQRDIQEQIKGLKSDFIDKTKELKDLESDLKEKIEETKKGVIESLALFAAFFTFVAVNVQIFTKVTNLRSAMLFTLLLAGCLIFFAMVVHVIINYKPRSKYLDAFFWITLIVFAFIFIFIALYFGGEKLYIDTDEMSKIDNRIGVEIHDNDDFSSKNIRR